LLGFWVGSEGALCEHQFEAQATRSSKWMRELWYPNMLNSGVDFAFSGGKLFRRERGVSIEYTKKQCSLPYQGFLAFYNC